MPYDIFGNPVTYEELAKKREEILNRRWFIAGVIVGFIICLAIVATAACSDILHSF